MKILLGTLSPLTFKPLLHFIYLVYIFIFECYLRLSDFSFVFQRFDKLAFSLCQRALRSLQKILQYRINKITTYRCCHQEVFRQIGVRPFSKKLQNPRKTFLKNIFECCSFIFTGKMKLIEFLHK